MYWYLIVVYLPICSDTYNQLNIVTVVVPIGRQRKYLQLVFAIK